MRSRSSVRRVLSLPVRAALSTALVHGTKVRLAEQLPDDDYREVAEVLAALGGLWSPAAFATVFPAGADPQTLIGQVLADNVVPLHPRTAEGWVRTPDDLADDLCSYPNSDLAWLPPGSRVLEPSAGIGSLAAAMLRVNPDLKVTAIEPHPGRAAVCAALGEQVTVHVERFEAFAAKAAAAGWRYAGIVMNPPFSIPTDRRIWVEHLRLAWHLLAPGARLVCVVPDGFSYVAACRDVRAFVEHYGRHDRMPFEAFDSSGTACATRRVTLTKPVRPGGTDFLFPPARPAVPVRVDEPRFTGEAAVGASVQVWWDGWRARDRVLRYRGRCIECGWLLWGADDGENDPRGILGDFTAGFSLDPVDYDRAGPEVGLCCGCANDGDLYRSGLAKAQTHWSEPAVTPALVPAA